jgi:hypothetical protein
MSSGSAKYESHARRRYLEKKPPHDSKSSELQNQISRGRDDEISDAVLSDDGGPQPKASRDGI